MKKYFAVCLGALVVVMGCAYLPMGKMSLKTYLKDSVQTQKFAEVRSSLVSNVQYKLNINVSEPGDFFSGDQQIIFDIKAPQDIYIDFQGGDILSTQVNSKVQKILRGPIYILISKDMLVSGTNTVQFVFRHSYSKSGTGLHKFKDPEDNKIYMYTDFEPYDASKWAPLFDQPDLKATFELTVKAPAHWTVVANTKETSFEKAGSEAYWRFPKTLPMSTYVFAMMAGPYHIWESQYKEIPLRIMVRDSLKKYVPYQDWFKITQKGFEFFENYFDFPYPFKKYDQIIVPEFNSGAMENIGAVTFSEKYLRRKDYTRFELRGLFSTALHEMAHMWFGDIVTMKWWNDLWLNESFATYMATLSLVKATEYKDSWVNFSIGKQGAYKQDESITTHPIAAHVENSNQAFTNFDSITYGKGAAVMKELSHYLGENLFRDSLRAYIKKHQYGSATLEDFIAAFNETSKLNLTPWFDAWLKTTGVDEVKQSFICEPNKLRFDLEVSPHGKPRTIHVAGFKKSWGEIKEVATVLVQTQGLKEIELVSREVEFEKKAECPDFIYANYGDHGYFKIEFDDKSLLFLEENINLIKSDLLRASIWSDLWRMVRDQKYKVEKFANLALKALESEENQEILIYLTQKTLGSRGSQYDSVYYFMPRSTAAEKSKYNKMMNDFSAVVSRRMQKAVADRYKIFLDAYLASVNSSSSLNLVVELLKKTDDPDMRWRMLHTLCSEGYLKVKDLVETELSLDKSDMSYKSSLACFASRPDEKVKAEFMQSLLSDKMSYSSDEVDRIAGSLFPSGQREQIKKFSSEIFMALSVKWPKLDLAYQSDLAYGLVPVYCEDKSSHALKGFLDSSVALPQSLKKPLLNKYDEDKRCLAVREFNKN